VKKYRKPVILRRQRLAAVMAGEAIVVSGYTLVKTS
jgi:hypothetical protein